MLHMASDLYIPFSTMEALENIREFWTLECEETPSIRVAEDSCEELSNCR
jgi:hypothetical protein